MSKKIFAGRGSLIGDTVMFLPALTILEKVFPNSYKIFPISQKTSYSSVFFLNNSEYFNILSAEPENNPPAIL